MEKIQEEHAQLLLERETAHDENEELWRAKQKKRQTLSIINRMMGTSDSPLANFAHEGTWIQSEAKAVEIAAKHWQSVFKVKHFTAEEEERHRFPANA